MFVLDENMDTPSRGRTGNLSLVGSRRFSREMCGLPLRCNFGSRGSERERIYNFESQKQRSARKIEVTVECLPRITQ